VSQFNDPLAVIIVVAFVIIIMCQIHYLNQGLKYCSALFMVPAYYSTNTILAILCGTIYNKTWRKLSYLQCTLFGGGAVIVLIGVLILTVKVDKTKSSQAGERDSQDNIEHGLDPATMGHYERLEPEKGVINTTRPAHERFD